MKVQYLKKYKWNITTIKSFIKLNLWSPTVIKCKLFLSGYKNFEWIWVTLGEWGWITHKDFSLFFSRFCLMKNKPPNLFWASCLLQQISQKYFWSLQSVSVEEKPLQNKDKNHRYNLLINNKADQSHSLTAPVVTWNKNCELYIHHSTLYLLSENNVISIYLCYFELCNCHIMQAYAGSFIDQKSNHCTHFKQCVIDVFCSTSTDKSKKDSSLLLTWKKSVTQSVKGRLKVLGIYSQILRPDLQEEITWISYNTFVNLGKLTSWTPLHQLTHTWTTVKEARSIILSNLYMYMWANPLPSYKCIYK